MTHAAPCMSLEAVQTRVTDHRQPTLLPMLRARLALFIVLLMLPACCSCSLRADLAIAEAAVAHFHDQFNAGQFQDIYLHSGAQLKNSAPQIEFINFLSGVQRKLGVVKQTRMINFTVRNKSIGTFAWLVYRTEFAEGKGRENFAFEIKGDQAILIGYHIKSPLLTAK